MMNQYNLKFTKILIRIFSKETTKFNKFNVIANLFN